MTKANDDEKRANGERHEASRRVQLYALLMGALLVLNVLIYWERGSKLSLVVAGICGVALVGYLVYARRSLRTL